MRREHPNEKYIVFSALFTVAGALSVVLPIGFWARCALAAVYFVGNGYQFGRRALPDEKSGWQTVIGFASFVATVAALGGLVYFVRGLDIWSTLAVMLAAPVLPVFVSNGTAPEPSILHGGDGKNATGSAAKRVALALAGLLLSVGISLIAMYGLGLLSGAATELSVRSPWDDMPRLFFIVFALVAAGTSALSSGRFAGTSALIPCVLLAALAVSVAASVYEVGFGFDPFIHQATEKHIFAYGQMLPKTPYYVGQYAIVTVLARMLNGYVTAIDAWLVPIAFSLLVLPTAFWSVRKAFNWPSGTSAAATLALLALPLSSFVMTTPQGLANVFLLVAVFLALTYAAASAVPLWLVATFAAACAATHPLAGVPLCVFLLSVAYLRHSERIAGYPKIRWLLFIKLFVLTSVALPLVFLLNARLSGTQVALDNETVGSPTAIIEELKNPEVESRKFSAALDFAYSWRGSRTATFAFAGAVGAILLWLASRAELDRRRRETAVAFAAGALAFFVNYVLLRTWVNFPFLIEYERSNYADRMAELALFALAPLAVYAFGRLLMRINRRGFPTLALALTLLVSAVLCSNVYLAYPRRDKYDSSRGWSTSVMDVRAVHSIDIDADGRDYVVLANQSVSAAAIRELGFRKYFDSREKGYDKPVFFYPIPTGERLYEIFLDANEELGSRASVERAMDLTGAKVAYFVVDHYWWQAQKITVNAAREADEWWDVEEKVWVFKYKL